VERVGVAEAAGSVDPPADWLARLRHGLHRQPDHSAGHGRLGGALITVAELRPAAVLVPIVDRPAGPTLLLTMRARHLRQHAGQISFPGGRIEGADVDPVAAALRETEEEIGVAPHAVEVLGFLPDHLVLSGYRITPVIGLVRADFQLRIDSAEVEEVFELPLGYLCARTHFVPTRRTVRGLDVIFQDLVYEQRVIWGATAAMLLALHETLLARP